MRREFYNLNDTLKISHLVVNGCSFTYGQGIENPIQDAWPSIVARELGVPLINLAIPGQGNPPIQRRTLDYFYKDLYNHNNPFYIHAYSQSARQEVYIYKRHEQVIQDYRLLDSSGDGPYISQLEKEIVIQSDDYKYILLEKGKFHIWATINGLLDSYNINHMSTDYMPDANGEVSEWMHKHEYSLMTEIETHPSKLTNFNIVTTEIPKLPCSHETKEGHAFLAEYVLSEIKLRYKTIEVTDREHAKMHDMLVLPPNVQKDLEQMIEKGNSLVEMVRHYPNDWTRNIYYLNELGLDLSTQDWMGKPTTHRHIT